MEKYSLSEERYKKYMSKFFIKDLLYYFAQESIKSYDKDEKAFTIVDVPYINLKTGEKKVLKNFNYGQWDLISICYNAIKYGNDITGWKVNEHFFYEIINEHKIYEEEKENVKGIDRLKLFEHLQCITNVQMELQHIAFASDFNRMYHILSTINENKAYDQTPSVCYINFKSIFKHITSISIDKFIQIYNFIILLIVGKKLVNVYDIIGDIWFNEVELGFTREEIKKVLDIISKDYEFYRNGDNWNLLKYYPIVKISEEEYIVSNIYALVASFSDTIYWIIRNYYNSLKLNNFTIYFGKCFEYYLKELLEYYKIKHVKIEELNNGEKVPDWKIETEKYIFLVEQKSALFPIDTKTTTSDTRLKKIEKYFDDNIIKAFKQLDSYQVNDEGKIIVRISLMFEKIYMKENVMSIVEERYKFNSPHYLNWIVTIDEFELLMEILSSNESEFNKLIERKIELEYNRDLNGRSFERLLAGKKYGYTMKELNYFEKNTNNIVKRLKQSIKTNK